jgi:hypothetical protein
MMVVTKLNHGGKTHMRTLFVGTLTLASLLIPAAAFASTSPEDASTPANPIRVSTGVVAPQIENASSITLPTEFAAVSLPNDAKIGLKLTVDAQGNAHNIKVTKSLNPFWDARIVEAVEKAHYHAGTVSNQPTPMDLNLDVTIAR